MPQLGADEDAAWAGRQAGRVLLQCGKRKASFVAKPALTTPQWKASFGAKPALTPELV